MKNQLKNIIIYLVIFCFLVFFCGYIIWQIQPPSQEKKSVTFIINEGEGINEIGNKLKTKGLVKNSFFFALSSYFTGAWTKFQAGEYDLSPDMNHFLIIKTFLNGPKPQEKTITILEGWTNNDIALYLENQNVVKKEDFLKALQEIDTSSYDFLKDKPQTAGLEGYLFPDTYRIYAKSSPKTIISKMLQNFQNKFNEEKIKAVNEQKRTIFEVVTLASLIEKEAKDKEDRRIVSGIFQKRLEMGMSLESCATINYLLEKPKEKLTNEDLKIDSPYNTYLYPGLPPGPINNPGLESIEAAIWPIKTDYLYFLAGPEGKNVYAKTFEEHQKNKEKYLK